jgi:hypothetical protein
VAVKDLKLADFDIFDYANPGSCARGTMRPGVYRIVLGGGNGGRWSSYYSNFTYNFRLVQFATYELCVGEPGKIGTRGAFDVAYDGSGGGGGGSYLKLSVLDEGDAYFIASGTMGGFVHDPNHYICYGGEGGALGPGLRGCYNNECGCWTSRHNGRTPGDGGANGSGNPAGRQTLAIRTIAADGTVSQQPAKEYGQYGNTYSALPPAQSHASNVSDPQDCSSCGKLYRN